MATKPGWGIGYGAGTGGKQEANKQDEINRTTTVIGNRMKQGLDNTAQLAHYKNLTGQDYQMPTANNEAPTATNTPKTNADGVRIGWGIGYGAGSGATQELKKSDEIERTRTVIANRTKQGLDITAQLAHYKNLTGQDYSTPIEKPQEAVAPVANEFDQQAYLEKNQGYVNDIYEQQKQAKIAELKAQQEKAVGQINQQKAEVAPQYQSARNQADVVNMQNVQRLREAIASAGLTASGENVTAQVSQNNQRQESINNLNLQEQQTVDDFNRRIADINNPETERAILAALDVERNKALYDAYVRADEVGYSRNRDNITDQRYYDETNYNRNRDYIGDTRYQEEQMYNRGRDTVEDQRYNDQFNYQKQRDNVGDSQWEKQFEYGKQRDQVGDNQWQQTFDQQKAQFESEKAWREYTYNNMSASEKAQLEWNKEQFGEEAAWRMYELEYSGELNKSLAQGQLDAYGGGTGLDFLP